MIVRLWNIVSMNEKSVFSALIYMCLALLVLSITPDLVVTAQSGCSGTTCASGEICCGGECIAASDLCCDDGTSGPSDGPAGAGTCGCCSNCSDAGCTVSTYYCEPAP